MPYIDARGLSCPIPVINARNALKEMSDGETLTMHVDNEITVQNLEKMAVELNYQIVVRAQDSECYDITIFNQDGINEAVSNAPAASSVMDIKAEKPEEVCRRDYIIVVSSSKMGEGDEQLGKALLKAFIYSLSEAEDLPEKIIFYNSGAFVTTDHVEFGDAIGDLKKLEAMGVEIMTCGACLDYYKLFDKLAVGSVTNMYSILNGMMAASKVIKP